MGYAIVPQFLRMIQESLTLGLLKLARGESVTLIHITRLKAAIEPALALCARAVRKAVRDGMAACLTL